MRKVYFHTLLISILLKKCLAKLHLIMSRKLLHGMVMSQGKEMLESRDGKDTKMERLRQ